MIERHKGKIIVIISAGAAASFDYNSLYCISKAAAARFVQTLAREWAPYNINVNRIGPSWALTEAAKHLLELKGREYLEKEMAGMPLGRPAEPREIGLLAVYLASESSDMVTGQNIYIDGWLTGAFWSKDKSTPACRETYSIVSRYNKGSKQSGAKGKTMAQNLRRNRPSKTEHYLNRAKVAAERSTCLRRKVGAVIIRDDTEVSSGYVGSPRDTENCIDIGSCIRIELGTPSGERYELCRSVHAEQNAIINAARTGAIVLNGEMYISSELIGSAYAESPKKMSQTNRPCALCMKEILNAGIKKVHMRDELSGEVGSYSADDLKKWLDAELKRLGGQRTQIKRR